MTMKRKILMLGDHALSTSGVGTQSRWLIMGLINTGKYSFRCFGGAVKHDNYDTITVNPDFIIKPTNGFGDQNMLRQVLVQEKPDALLLFTDPRFFLWVWEMEDEIHQICPIAYNHLWDNPPWPEFNRVLYESTDLINCINYPTYQMVHERFPDKTNYVPHAVPEDVYFPMPEESTKRFKANVLGQNRIDHFIVTYVSRNARRKLPSDVVASFKQFLDKVESNRGHRKSTLVMHTDPLDPEGPNLHHVVDMLGLKDNVVFSKDRIDFGGMNSLYNVSDVIVNMSCFPAGTKVASFNGLKNIETLNVGDSVMTHTGQLQRILNTMVKSYTGKMVNLTVTNNDAIQCTEEHPNWAIKRERLTAALKNITNNSLGLIRDHLTKTIINELAEFVPASSLKVGDKCIYAAKHMSNISETISFDMTKYIGTTNYAQHEVVNGQILLKNHTLREQNAAFCSPANVSLTPALGYVLGNWIADGTTHTASIAFNIKDDQKMMTLSNMINEAFMGMKTYQSKSKSNCVLLNIVNNSIVEKFINDVCGAYSHGKHVPEFIFDASTNVKRAFVAGLMAGDGCILTHPKYKTLMSRYRTISARLAMELKDVLTSLGYCVSMSHDDNSHGYNKQGKIWCLEWRDRKNGYNGSCRSWNVEGTYVVETVTKISTCDVQNIPVYNLEIENDNSYRLQGITVHNCNEGFGLSVLEAKMAGKLVVAIKTGGLTRQVEDHVTGIQFGVGLDPEVRCLVGNQMIPYIFEDFVSHETVSNALMKVYDMGPEKRLELGQFARAHALHNYNMPNLINEWDRTLTQVIATWKQKHKRWGITEL